MFFIQNINKASLTALLEYCNPPEPEDEEEEHPHTGNNLRHAIIVYMDKCTTIAGKEIDAYTEIEVERFKIEEILRIPLIFGFNISCKSWPNRN